jgi:hypothetical protein
MPDSVRALLTLTVCIALFLLAAITVVAGVFNGTAVWAIGAGVVGSIPIGLHCAGG